MGVGWLVICDGPIPCDGPESPWSTGIFSTKRYRGETTVGLDGKTGTEEGVACSGSNPFSSSFSSLAWLFLLETGTA